MQEYTREWITSIRENSKLSKTAFAEKIIQFKKERIKKDKKAKDDNTEDRKVMCLSVHRNTIGNWESGKTDLPRDVETFLSLALLDYDSNHDNDLSDIEKRNERYYYARSLMNQMLGVDLYCRHLHDALLMQVCRGILKFQDLLPLEEELENELSKVSLTASQENEYAMERNTISVNDDLIKVDDLESFKNLITVEYRNTFASANRTIGARVSNIYKKRNRYPYEVALGKAVAVMAPNYRDSYLRMFKSSFISRDWMIDFCLHLRFSEEEINEALECSHMALLNPDELKGRYSYEERLQIGLREKFQIMFLLGMYMENLFCISDCPPVSYLIEAFTDYDYGKKALKQLEEFNSEQIQDFPEFEDVYERLPEIIKDNICRYIDSVHQDDNFDNRLYQNLRKETIHYFDPGEMYANGLKNKDEALLLHYYAALCYTILTGKIYQGKLRDVDFEIIGKQFGKMDDTTQAFIYRFVTHFLGTFLGGDSLKETKGRHTAVTFYTVDKNTKKAGKTLGAENLLKDLWESIPFLEAAQTEVAIIE